MSKKISSKLRAFGLLLNRIFSSKYFTYAIIIIFVLQAIYILFSVKIGVPPDELTHIRFIEFYAKQENLSPIISSQTDSFALGDVTREVSYLYHYLMSLVLRITELAGLSAYVFLRFAGLAMTVATLFFVIRTAKLLEVPNKVIATSLLVVTNMAQFLLMSIAINNDNAIWLLTAASIFVLVKLWQSKTGQLRYLLWLVVLLVFGVIIKKTFMPLALIFTLTATYYLWQNRNKFKDLFASFKFIEIVMSLIIIVGIGLVGERVGINLIKYNKIDAVCDQIHSVENCKNYGVYRRNFELYETAGTRTREINILQFKLAWAQKTVARSFGVQAWPGEIETPVVFNLSVIALLTLALVYGLKNWRSDTATLLILAVSLYYIVFNMLVNYSLYKRWGVFDLALQGRYIFPILVPLVIFSTYILWRGLGAQGLTRLRMPLAIVVISSVIFVSGLQLFVSDTRFISNPIKPVIIFNSSNAISKYEPGY